jgi:sugar phosphate isomerase/epimerase
MTLAVQLYSVRDRLVEDRPGTLRALADAGYDAVEPFRAHIDPHGLRADLDAAGLTVCSAHADLLGADADAAFAAAPVLGTDTLIQAYLPPERFVSREAVADTAQQLNTAAVRAAGTGLRLGYHNHYWEVGTLIDGTAALEVLADLLTPEVLLEVDLYWAATGGADVPALLGRLGERVRFLHVKDGPATVEGPMTAVGEGVVPITASLAAAPGAHRIVELDRCAGDVLEALVTSAAALR